MTKIKFRSALEKNRETKGYKVFKYFNYVILWALAALCVLPMVHVLAMSLSERVYADAGMVGLWPKGFTFVAYQYVFNNNMFFITLKNSVIRTVGGVALTVVVNILLAFPMSKSRQEFKGRPVFLAIIVFTMFFNGGIIPDYLLVNSLGLTNNMWGIIIPCGINTFNVIILRTFFLNSIPAGLQEAAQIDGCNDFMILVRIVLPLSKPVLATLALFYAVARWNGFQDAKFYINKQELYTLPQKINMIINSSQLSSQTMMNNPQLAEQRTAEEGIKAASIVFTTLPILLVYPWLQKYFVHGVMIGAIKE